MGCQTDKKITRTQTPIKKSTKSQTEKLKDLYKDDWAQSLAFKRAMRAEAFKRNLTYNDKITDDEEDDTVTADEAM